MNTILFVLILIPLTWLYAEFKFGRSARLSLGLLSIVVTAFVTYSFGLLSQDNERAWHRNSIKAASDFLAKGDTYRVQRAFDAYNTTVATSSTFRASEAMWHALKTQ